MAFTSSINNNGVPEFLGRLKCVHGTFANTGGSTGGEVVTGLRKVYALILQHTGAAVVASAPVVNETMPFDGSSLTIVTVADTSGTWMAIGE